MPENHWVVEDLDVRIIAFEKERLVAFATEDWYGPRLRTGRRAVWWIAVVIAVTRELTSD